jgi:thiol-disulfide isomerase/thioredoxin
MIVTFITAILGIAWINATRVDPGAINPTGKPPSPDVGHPAPDFTLTNLSGETISLSNLKGRPVLLNFWATWCGPCRAEIPALQAASEIISDEGVILGVNVQEQIPIVSDFALRRAMTYPIVLDLDARVARLYRVHAYPTTYFIDPRGVISELYTGSLNAPLIQRRIHDLSQVGQ